MADCLLQQNFDLQNFAPNKKLKKRASGGLLGMPKESAFIVEDLRADCIREIEKLIPESCRGKNTYFCYSSSPKNPDELSHHKHAHFRYGVLLLQTRRSKRKKGQREPIFHVRASVAIRKTTGTDNICAAIPSQQGTRVLGG